MRIYLFCLAVALLMPVGTGTAMLAETDLPMQAGVGWIMAA